MKSIEQWIGKHAIAAVVGATIIGIIVGLMYAKAAVRAKVKSILDLWEAKKSDEAIKQLTLLAAG